MRSRFDEQLAQLHRELIEMGALCERVIALAAKALTTGDKALAQQVPPHQQPVAGDLRRISAALKMITDMERIGDQADDIAEIVLYLADVPAESHVLLQKMAEAAIGMVSDSVDAYVRQDVELAEQVIAHDDTVDDYFEQVKQALIHRIANDPAEGGTALDLLMIAKYLERIGDHATNIAEWVEFSVTGVHKEG